MKKILFAVTLIALLLVSCTSSTIKKSTKDSLEAYSLPDGSIALLNKNSSIKYNEGFEDRTVNQTGEIFYIVTKGETPFTVETEKGNIEVLGTEFNVKSSKEELEIEVEKGIVRLKVDEFVKDVKRGQRALINEIENGISVGKAEFKHKLWTKSLESQLKKLVDEIDKGSKEIKEESKKFGKDLKNKLNKINNNN